MRGREGMMYKERKREIERVRVGLGQKEQKGLFVP